MHNYYIILILVLLIGAVVGYYLGGVRIMMALIKIAAATTAVIWLTAPAADWLINYCMMELVYAPAVASTVIFMVSFIAVDLITRPFIKWFAVIHKNIFNRIAGMLTVAAAAGIACIFCIQYGTAVPVFQELAEGTQQKDFILSIGERVKQVADKFTAVTEPQKVQVMAVNKIEPVQSEGIQLPFSTTHHTIRPDLEIEMLNLVNRERSRQGLRLLTFDTTLMKAARLHAADMLARGYFSHHTPEGLDPFQRLYKLNISYCYAGENLAFAPALIQAHEGLMKSPGHRANILNHSYGRVGIGILDAGVYGLMVTQEFRD